jgi:hypothetical protein
VSMICVVPTRARPEQCKRLIKSFEDTTDNATLLFVTDGDDDSYEDFDWHGHGVAEIDPRASLSQKLNHTVKNIIDDYEEIMWQGDDHEFITPHWDSKFLEARAEWGPGWLYPNNHRRSDVPESWSASRDVVEALGWYANPVVAHYYLDNSIAELGKRTGLIRWLPEVEITHHHYSVDKDTEYDGLYKETEQRFGEHDIAAFQQWRGSNQVAAIVSLLRRRFNPDVAWVLSKIGQEA